MEKNFCIINKLTNIVEAIITTDILPFECYPEYYLIEIPIHDVKLFDTYYKDGMFYIKDSIELTI